MAGPHSTELREVQSRRSWVVVAAREESWEGFAATVACGGARKDLYGETGLMAASVPARDLD